MRVGPIPKVFNIFLCTILFVLSHLEIQILNFYLSKHVLVYSGPNQQPTPQFYEH